jgi:anti-sigma factor RsiW
MNSEFEFNYLHPPGSGEQDQWFDEKFELLSAYIDGEVSPQERAQVQAWIDNDPEFKQTYLGLIRLQTGLGQMPIPASISTDQLAQQVFDRLDRESRWRRLWLFGGIATVTVVVAACSSMLVKPLDSSLKEANLAPALATMEADPLMVAINEPMFDSLTKPAPGDTFAGERGSP